MVGDRLSDSHDHADAIPRRDRACVFGIGAGGYAGWAKGKIAIDKAAKLKEPWTVHDIRRTVRTGMGMLGVLPHVAEAALNHLPSKPIRTYDRNRQGERGQCNGASQSIAPGWLGRVLINLR